MKKTLSWIMVLLMVFAPFAATVINVSAEVLNQENTAAGTQSEAEQSPVNVDTISTTMNMSPIPEQTSEPPYEIIVVHCSGGSFTGEKAGYESLHVTLKEGRLLPTDLSWYQPERSGYRFEGWYAYKDGSIDKTKVYKGGETVPDGVTDFYASWVRVVVLDAAPGSFANSNADQNYTRTVDIVDGKFPKVEELPVYNIDDKENQTVLFDGWYTEKTKITKQSSGDYWTVSIQNNGQKIEEGKDVPEGITTLYAGYKLKEGTTPQKTITYYYDWNGINGMWGQCLTSSRAYSDDVQGHKLTVGDLLILYLNWNSADDVTNIKTQETLNAYWEDNTFNGYTFLGWATTPTAEKPDVKVDDVVKNGQSLYAVWEKDGEHSKDFDRSESSAGPLSAMRFLDLSQSTHGTEGASLTVELYITPVRANLKDLTWTIVYGEPREISEFAPPVTKTETVKNGETFTGTGFTVTANADSHTLTIKNTDGQEHSLTISAAAVSDNGETVSTPASVTVSFTHKWEAQKDGEHVDPTCTERGYETYKCSDCEATKKKAIPPLEHLWKFQITKEPTCTETGIMEMQCIRENCHTTFAEYQKWMSEKYGKKVETIKEPEIIPALGHDYEVTSTDSIDENGMRCFTEECSSCQTEESGQYGDVNKDGEVSLVDAVQMYQFLNEQVDSLSQEVAGDIDGSNDVTEGDAEKLYEYVSGQTPSL